MYKGRNVEITVTLVCMTLCVYTESKISASYSKLS